MNWQGLDTVGLVCSTVSGVGKELALLKSKEPWDN